MCSKLTGSIFGSWGALTLLRHGHKVQCAVETAGQLGEVYVKCEFTTWEIEHLVIVLVLQQICAASDVGRILTLRDELQGQAVGTSSDTIGTWNMLLSVQ